MANREGNKKPSVKGNLEAFKEPKQDVLLCEATKRISLMIQIPIIPVVGFIRREEKMMEFNDVGRLNYWCLG